MMNIKRVTVGAALLLTMLASVFSASAETVKTFSPASDRALVVGGAVPAVAVSNGLAGAVTQVADRDDHRFYRGFWWRRDGWGRWYRVDRDDFRGRPVFRDYRWHRDFDDRWRHDRDDRWRHDRDDRFRR